MFHYCIQPQRKEQTKILLNPLEKEIFLLQNLLIIWATTILI